MDYEKLRTKKFTFKEGSTIDGRYFFANEDGTYTPTELFIYTVAMSVRDKAFDAICKLDTNRQYTNVSKEKTRPDAWEVKQHELMYKAENAQALEKKDAEWKTYQREHPDEFVQQEAFPTGNEDQNRYLSHCRPNIEFTSLNDAISHFMAANTWCAKYGKADPTRLVVGEPIPTTVEPMIKLFSKEEFKEAHAKVKEELDKKYGIPVNDTKEWKTTDACPKETYTTMSFSTKKDVTSTLLNFPMSTDHVEDFVNTLSENLVGSTPQLYKEELYAKLTGGDVTRNFVAAFTETRMAFLTDDSLTAEYVDATPAWRVKCDDDNDPNEIIVRAKSPLTKGVQTIITIRKTEDVTIPYLFLFKVDLADGQSVSFKVFVTTQNDITKALNKCIVLIDDTPFEVYRDSLQSAYENYKATCKK